MEPDPSGLRSRRLLLGSHPAAGNWNTASLLTNSRTDGWRYAAIADEAGSPHPNPLPEGEGTCGLLRRFDLPVRDQHAARGRTDVDMQFASCAPVIVRFSFISYLSRNSTSYFPCGSRPRRPTSTLPYGNCGRRRNMRKPAAQLRPVELPAGTRPVGGADRQQRIVVAEVERTKLLDFGDGPIGHLQRALLAAGVHRDRRAHRRRTAEDVRVERPHALGVLRHVQHEPGRLDLVGGAPRIGAGAAHGESLRQSG